MRYSYNDSRHLGEKGGEEEGREGISVYVDPDTLYFWRRIDEGYSKDSRRIVEGCT